MNFDALIKKIDDFEVVDAVLNNGETVKYRKIPLSLIDNIENVLDGVKTATFGISVGSEAIARCGTTPLFYAVGDINQYLKRGDSGAYLSSTRGKNGTIIGQPGFKESGIFQEGASVAHAIGTAIPYVAIAIAVIDIGLNIYKNKKQIQEEENRYFCQKNYELYEDKERLWRILDERCLIDDEANRTSNIHDIDGIIDNSKVCFQETLKYSNTKKTITDDILFTLKNSLDLYSFSTLLKVLFIKVSDKSMKEYLNKASKNVNELNKNFGDVATKKYKELVHKDLKNKNVQKATQFDNNKKDLVNILLRGGAAVLSGGVTELISVSSKCGGNIVNKNMKKEIDKVEEYVGYKNEYLNCIKSISKELEFNEKGVLTDSKNLYYRIP